MELRNYWRALRRGWIVVSSFCMVGVLCGAIAAITVSPTYAARTQLFVAIQSSGTVSELQQGNTFSQARVQSYVRTATTPIVLQPVIDELGLDVSLANLASKIQATAEQNTVLISITAIDDSPVRAAAIAQAVAESLVRAVAELEGSSPVELSVVTPAAAPTKPDSPNTGLYILLGLLCGGSIGIAYTFMRALTDSKVRGEDDLVRITDLPLLGGVSFDEDVSKFPLLTQTSHQSPRAEAFRQIRTNLQFANVNSSSRTVLVTSSLPGEGKSTTAVNMAIALAQSGQRVILIDADLRRPTIAGFLGLENGAGLTTALIGAADTSDLLQPWGEDELYVLTSGQIPPNPSELLGSHSMELLLAKFSTEFDAVVIDAPPLIPVTDAAVLAQKVGGVVLVVGTGKIKTQDLQKSLSSLELVDANIMGVVLNLLPAKGPDAYAYSYYSYETKPESSRRAKGRTDKTLNATHLKSSRRPSTRTSPSKELLS